MPELPEVETMRRGLLGAVGHRVISSCRTPCRKKPLFFQPRWPVISRRIENTAISLIGRHGKRLKIHFGDEWTMVIEPRMSGLVLLGQPPTDEHLRFEIELDDGSGHLRFWDRRGLGRVFLFSPSQHDEYFSPSRIGPDAMEITADQLAANLARRRIAVKLGLLDQQAVAGVGNIYASEILHLARIDPRMTCNQLTAIQWERVHQYLISVMHNAIKYEGSTLSDGTYRNALNDPGSYQNEHRVYDRAGLTCVTCGRSNVLRIVQAQRSTFFCPRCQSRGTRRHR